MGRGYYTAVWGGVTMATIHGEKLLYSCLGRGNYGNPLWGEVTIQLFGEG